MLHRLQFAVLFLLVAVIGTSASAQKQKAEIFYLDPDKVERTTKPDAQGVLQWDEWKHACPSCKGQKTTPCLLCDRVDDNKHCIGCGGKRVATCWTCGGVGVIPDPLDKVLCPGCRGAALMVCQTCRGLGTRKIKYGPGTEKSVTCPVCKGEGGWKCGVCGGSRLVETLSTKPALRDAPLATLKKAKEQVDALAKVIDGILPSSDPRRDVKEFGKALGSATTFLDPLRRSPKVCEDIMGKTLAGSQWADHKETEARTFKVMQDDHVYYLKWVQRMIDAAIARAEANDKAAVDKPKKD